MALRKMLFRPLPEVPEEPPTTQTVVQQVLETLPIAPFRLFWDNFNTMRPWWPVLVPLLAWVAWRTYQRERAAVLTHTEDAT
jgi:hypothetical protein